MKKKPFFSVVIPTFNSEKTILKTLWSVKKQSFKNFQVIIVDDGSEDNTVFLIEKFISENNLDIKLFKIKNSGGPAVPRNLAIKNSDGDWICFLDSDDYWFSNKLQDANYFLKHNYNETDVLCSNEIMIYKKKKIRLIYGPETKDFYMNLLKNGNKLSTSATIVKKNFLKYKNIFFNENIKFSSVEDYDFWLQIAKYGGKFNFLNKFCGLYLISENSISKNRSLHFQNTRNVVNFHYSELNKQNKTILLFFKIKFRIFMSFIIISIKEGNLKLLFKIIKEIFVLKI